MMDWRWRMLESNINTWLTYITCLCIYEEGAGPKNLPKSNKDNDCSGTDIWHPPLPSSAYFMIHLLVYIYFFISYTHMCMYICCSSTSTIILQFNLFQFSIIYNRLLTLLDWWKLLLQKNIYVLHLLCPHRLHRVQSMYMYCMYCTAVLMVYLLYWHFA